MSASEPSVREPWLEAAAEVRLQVVSNAHRAQGGSVVWLADHQGERPVPLGPQLYDGSCGVALFLAAHHRASGDPEDRELALAAIAPLAGKLRQLAADRERAAALRLGVGALVGVGGFAYVLSRLADWLGNEELLDAALACLSFFDAARIAADDRFDVMSGCAGGVLALLAVERQATRAGDDAASGRALDAAAACARHLLDRRVAWRGGPRAWPGPEGRPPLSGFAHGAAGISHALLRLHRRTGEAAWLDAAVEGLAFERSLYLEEVDGWLDPRFDRPVEQSAWCHGTPGIALGRLAAVAVLDDAETRSELDRLLRSTLELAPLQRDHLCCGNAGRVEVLLAAAQALGRHELAAAAESRAVEALDRAAAGGWVFDRPDGAAATQDPFAPSLFLGVAGVGYTLLRLADPEALPCPLLIA